MAVLSEEDPCTGLKGSGDDTSVETERILTLYTRTGARMGATHRFAHLTRMDEQVKFFSLFLIISRFGPRNRGAQLSILISSHLLCREVMLSSN